MPLFEDPDLSLPLPGRFARRAALLAAISMVSGLALVVSDFVPPASNCIEVCRRSAAWEYPGEVRLASAREVGGSTRIHLHIEARDGRETVVVCDGPSGRIVRAIDVDSP
ncbi:MAG TPA: hypothetical protein VH105_12560 [Burkholderiales bacterium]|jgi:hypothetical protein|nr:hypothetical protein [Burkholderiales bacterium]